MKKIGETKMYNRAELIEMIYGVKSKFVERVDGLRWAIYEIPGDYGGYDKYVDKINDLVGSTLRWKNLGDDEYLSEDNLKKILNGR